MEEDDEGSPETYEGMEEDVSELSSSTTVEQLASIGSAAATSRTTGAKTRASSSFLRL